MSFSNFPLTPPSSPHLLHNPSSAISVIKLFYHLSISFMNPHLPRRGGDRQGSEYRWGQGQCFSLTNGLAWEETWDPCSGRPTARAHEEWGYCQVLSPPSPSPPPPPPPSPSPPPPPSPPQAGTSAALLPDRTALIGTPGPHTWRGTVFAVSTSDVSIPYKLHLKFFPRNTKHVFSLLLSTTSNSLHQGPHIHSSLPSHQTPPATHRL